MLKLTYRYRFVRALEYSFLAIVTIVIGTIGSYAGTIFLLRSGGGLNDVQRFLLNNSNVFWIVFSIVGVLFVLLIAFKFWPKLTSRTCLYLELSDAGLIIRLNRFAYILSSKQRFALDQIEFTLKHDKYLYVSYNNARITSVELKNYNQIGNLDLLIEKQKFNLKN